jgi:hypothetical protein
LLSHVPSQEELERLTRKIRWEQFAEDLAYAPNELDRAIVAPNNPQVGR